MISARTEDQLREVAAKVEAAGRKAVVVPADLNDLDAVAGLADAAHEAFGRLDIVVNNVGGTMPRAFLDTSPRFLEEAFHFNVSTAHALTRAAVPHMLKGGGGSVVSISSAMGRLQGRGFVAYGTAKAALAHFTRLAATDLAPRVRVNAIAVGSVATSALDIVLTDDNLRKVMEDATPLHRIGDPEDIAAAIVYLCSDAGQLRHRQGHRGRRRPRPAEPRPRDAGPVSARSGSGTASAAATAAPTASCSGRPATSAATPSPASTPGPTSSWSACGCRTPTRWAATPASWPASGAPSGVAATDDADALLALRPDCIVHTAMADDRLFEALADLERFLRAGVNVVSSGPVFLQYPDGVVPDEMIDPVRQGALDGGVSLWVNGIDPGFANDWLPLVLTSVSERIDEVRCLEILNYATYDQAMVLFDIMGFGRPLDDVPILLQPTILTTAWGSVVRQIAAGLDVELDAVEEHYERLPAPETFEIASGTIEKGTAAALRFEVRGMRDGRAVIVLEHVTRLRDDLAPGLAPARRPRLLPGRRHGRAQLHPRPAAAGHATATTTPPGSRPPPCAWSTPCRPWSRPPGLLSALDLPLITAGVGLVGLGTRARRRLGQTRGHGAALAPRRRAPADPGQLAVGARASAWSCRSPSSTSIRCASLPLRTTGVLLAIPGVVALVAIPVAGTLVDRVGARWVLAGRSRSSPWPRRSWPWPGRPPARRRPVHPRAGRGARLPGFQHAAGRARPGHGPAARLRAQLHALQRRHRCRCADRRGVRQRARRWPASRPCSPAAPSAPSAPPSSWSSLPGPAGSGGRVGRATGRVERGRAPRRRAAATARSWPIPLRRRAFALSSRPWPCAATERWSRGCRPTPTSWPSCRSGSWRSSWPSTPSSSSSPSWSSCACCEAGGAAGALATVGLVWCASWLIFGAAALPGSASAPHGARHGVRRRLRPGRDVHGPDPDAADHRAGARGAAGPGQCHLRRDVRRRLPRVARPSSPVFIAAGLAGAVDRAPGGGRPGGDAHRARGCGRRLAPDQDIGEPELPPEPIPEPSAY